MANILKETTDNKSKKAIIATRNIFNAAIRKKYFPSLWQIIVILKSAKPENHLTSYRPISFLSITPKFRKTIPKTIARRIQIIDQWNLYSNQIHSFQNKTFDYFKYILIK